MKNNLFLTYFLVLLISGFSSCNQDNTRSSNGFLFELFGEVDNGDGVEIALYLPSKGLDNRYVSKIKDGKYSFRISANQIELAELRFEEDIINDHPVRAFSGIIIEPGEVELNFGVEGVSGNYSFGTYEFLSGTNNKFLFNEGLKIVNEMVTWVYGDSVRKDSMRNHVYPKVKSRTLKAFGEVCSADAPDATCLIILRKIVEGINIEGPFEREYLTSEELESLKTKLSNVNPKLEDTDDYQFVESILYTNPKLKVKFNEFNLVDIDENEISLQDICTRNRYTILDFWFSECLPCREFNERNRTIYPKLKTNGIEIVGINVDDSKSKWKNSSFHDKIQWINLYAGKNWKITGAYGVISYPTKIIFDSELNYISYDLKSLEEFIIWTESHKKE